MANTVAYAASMCTRKTNSSSNAKNGVTCQEFYDSSYNYVGIICFSGMNLANKVITGIWLSIDAARVKIACDNGTVNIRVGNSTDYARITAVPDGTVFEHIATAANGWHAVKVGSQVGWVAGKYSEITTE